MKRKIQKFFHGQRVHVCKARPRLSVHFMSNFDAIINGSYTDLYGGRSSENSQYSLYHIHDGKIINTTAWYEESQLTLVDKKLASNERMIQIYNRRHDEDEDYE